MEHTNDVMPQWRTGRPMEPRIRVLAWSLVFDVLLFLVLWGRL